MDAFRGNFSDYNQSIRFEGIYRGVIEDIADPDCRGRARIRIMGVHTAKVDQDEYEGIPTYHLP